MSIPLIDLSNDNVVELAEQVRDACGVFPLLKDTGNCRHGDSCTWKTTAYQAHRSIVHLKLWAYLSWNGSDGVVSGVLRWNSLWREECFPSGYRWHEYRLYRRKYWKVIPPRLWRLTPQIRCCQSGKGRLQGDFQHGKIRGPRISTKPAADPPETLDRDQGVSTTMLRRHLESSHPVRVGVKCTSLAEQRIDS